MIDPAAIGVLYKHIRRTARSLLQYASDSFPWTRNQADLEILDRLNQMLAEEQRDMVAIFHFLSQHRVSRPHLESYPVHFTSYNFLAVDRLLQLLHEYQAHDVEELETDVKQVQDLEVKRLLQQMLDTKKAHLDALEQMMDNRVPAGV